MSEYTPTELIARLSLGGPQARKLAQDMHDRDVVQYVAEQFAFICSRAVDPGTLYFVDPARSKVVGVITGVGEAK
jgi:hypothetical protein